ncbi:MAG: phytanoyl-CoA dioxygenase family protein [Emcibacter sp.]|nr:phytanoyl-CoA dioxygenase family protein [Emcibacter sp.]
MSQNNNLANELAKFCLSDDEKGFFLENGFVILRNILGEEERLLLIKEMDRLADEGQDAKDAAEDFCYGKGHKSGEDVLRRIDYIIDKSEACKVLLAHPYILRSVEKLMGKDFIPTWDASVFKLPGEGIVVPWHRDSRNHCAGETPIFNVDFYLDDADEDTCIWGIPKSHKWSEEKASPYYKSEDFSFEKAVPIPVKAGDVIFHNINVLHGSPANKSDKMRRVVYYEFRTASVETAKGPHRPDYIPLKQEQLLACIEQRNKAAYCIGEEPFDYTPPAPYDTVKAVRDGGMPTYRFVHKEYYREDELKRIEAS